MMTGLGIPQRLWLWVGVSAQLVMGHPRPQDGAKRLPCGPIPFPDVSCEPTTCSWVIEDETGYQNINKKYRRTCSLNPTNSVIENRRKTMATLEPPDTLRTNYPLEERSPLKNTRSQLSSEEVIPEITEKPFKEPNPTLVSEEVISEITEKPLEEPGSLTNTHFKLSSKDVILETTEKAFKEPRPIISTHFKLISEEVIPEITEKPLEEPRAKTNTHFKLTSEDIILENTEKSTPKLIVHPIAVESMLRQKKFRQGASKPHLKQDGPTKSTAPAYAKKLTEKTEKTQDLRFLQQFEQAITNADFEIFVLP